jgi:hypothetical protein
LVWEATQAFWQPDEIIADMFAANAEYAPISIGFEETGLNQWAMQPLRQAQSLRGSIPLRPVNPPRGLERRIFYWAFSHISPPVKSSSWGPATSSKS